LYVLRKTLHRSLGTERYLRFVSSTYIRLWRTGLISGRYPELAMMRRLLRPGDVCVDIGANLGYYSVEMARAVGPGGRVLAVEPVPMFRRILSRNLAGADNVEILPYALGAEDGRISLGTPLIDGVFRHGRTHVVSGQDEVLGATYEVEVRRPDDLFADLERIDYVKCDIEGYEGVVFPNLRMSLERHRPIVQVEITGAENRTAITQMMREMGYATYAVSGKALIPIELESPGGDFFFLGEHHRHLLEDLDR
jgi:FkbM family methyltransferase